jgi:transcriptional antiterminator Rof (Rho-off)
VKYEKKSSTTFGISRKLNLRRRTGKQQAVKRKDKQTASNVEYMDIAATEAETRLKMK